MKALSNVQQTIHGTNFLNKERLLFLSSIQDEFKAMIGTKVQLSDGGQSKKWTIKGGHNKTTKTINGIKVFLSYQWYFDFSFRSITLTSKICINAGSYEDNTAFTKYINQTDYIGELEDKMLTQTNHVNIGNCINHAIQEVSNPLKESVFNKQLKQYGIALRKANKIKAQVDVNLKEYLPKY